MPADLTRFDFNAHDFLNSECVEVMSDAEVGQYVLLLAKSWLMAKEASLPNEPDLLAKWAHCDKVSKKVLNKFEIVDTKWGKRLRNARLYEEWSRTLERYEVAAENGRKGGMSTSVYKIEAARENGMLGGRPKQNPSKTQYETETQTNQSKPIQTNQSNMSDFNNLSRRFKRKFGFKPGKRPQDIQEYSSACGKFGEEWILDKFNEWADDNDWVKERRAKFPLADFFNGLEGEKEDDDLNAIAKHLDEESAEAIQKQIEESRIKDEKRINSILAETEKQKEIEKSIPADAF